VNKTLLQEKIDQGQSLFMPDMVEIVEVVKFTELEMYYKFKFADGRDLGHLVGQFAELSLFGIGEVPISISSSPTQKGYFEMVIRNAGSVTNKIHQMKVGDKVGIRGPFGSCFPVEKLEGKDLLFVLGGLGLVPGRALINYVIDNRDKFGRFIILYGARNPKELLFVEELKAWTADAGIEYHVTVDHADESWTGNTGVITTLFPKVNIDPAKTAAIVIGPPVMYKFVIIECKTRNIADENIYMSLERRMKCGIGKCGHCQMNSLYVCCDGPVFTYDQVKDFEEAL
jgi:sulfite reductase subunit B